MSKKKASPFTVGLCSVCDQFRLCALTGSVKWCRECMEHSLGWVQMTEAHRKLMLALMDGLAQTTKVKKQLTELSTIDDETRQALAVGESRRRLYMEER